uniref:UDP-N-acetylmuramate dehydrogenase n=1 Tax=freshwater metagenome TaxID=449393 RepID=A0A6J5ZUL8_9ZZZZ
MDLIIDEAPLAPLTTLRIGGPAKRLWTVETEPEFVAAVEQLDRDGTPFFVLAGGSNVVVADEGFDGVVLHPVFEGADHQRRDDGSVAIEATAGAVWDLLVEALVDAGLSGVECLAGIPGSVGATPIQNVGAYGQEVAQTIEAVRVYNRDSKQVEELAGDRCGFGYRSSRLKGDASLIVLGVRFLLEQSPLSAPIAYRELAEKLGVAVGERADSADARAAVLELRGSKGMVLDEHDHDTWSAGSFFTNPLLDGGQFAVLEERVAEHCGGESRAPRFDAPDGKLKTSAAWLIEQAGFAKGDSRGQVGLSSKHTLALTNLGGATAAELIAFAHEIATRVEELFAVELRPEPALLGLEW